MDHENIHKSYLKRFQCQNLLQDIPGIADKIIEEKASSVLFDRIKKCVINGAENQITIMGNLLFFNYSKYRIPVALLSRHFFV